MPKTNKATPSRLYKKVNEKEPIDKNVYLELYKRFALQVKQELLDGNDWITNKIGLLAVRAIPIDTRARPINWKATKELWETCEECKEARQMVYFLTDWFYRVEWYKSKGTHTPAMNYYWFKQAETFSDDLTLRLRAGQEYYESEKSKHKKRLK